MYYSKTVEYTETLVTLQHVNRQSVPHSKHVLVGVGLSCGCGNTKIRNHIHCVISFMNLGIHCMYNIYTVLHKTVTIDKSHDGFIGKESDGSVGNSSQ